MNPLKWIGGLLSTSQAPDEDRQTIEYPENGLVLRADSSSGVPVTERTAVSYAAVFRAVSLIAGDVGKLPLITYRRLPDGGKERDTSHPAYMLLKRRPNEYQTPIEFLQTLIAWALLGGNGYAEIARDGLGRPVALYPRDWKEITPFRVHEPGVPPRMGYEYYSTTSAESRIIPGEDMIHVRSIGDDMVGYTTIGIAAESLGLGLAARTYGSVFFRNQGRPSVVLEHPARMSEEAAKRLRESWTQMHSGVQKAHRVAVLEEGTKLHAFGMPNDDAQFLETRQFEIREVANWFGVPAHKLNDNTRTSYNSIEASDRAYLAESLDPWLVRVEQECWTKLLTPTEQREETVSIDFVRQAFMRADMGTRSAFYQSALLGGWMSRDEIRMRENMNPIPGGEGEEFYVPLNVTTTGEDDDTETDTDETSADRAAVEPTETADREAALVGMTAELVRDAATAVCARLSRSAKRYAGNPSRYMEWIDELDDLADMIRGKLELPVSAVRTCIGGEDRLDLAVQTVIRGFRAVLLDASEAKPHDLPDAVAAGVGRASAQIPAAVIKATGANP